MPVTFQIKQALIRELPYNFANRSNERNKWIKWRLKQIISDWNVYISVGQSERWAGLNYSWYFTCISRERLLLLCLYLLRKFIQGDKFKLNFCVTFWANHLSQETQNALLILRYAMFLRNSRILWSEIWHWSHCRYRLRGYKIDPIQNEPFVGEWWNNMKQNNLFLYYDELILNFKNDYI